MAPPRSHRDPAGAHRASALHAGAATAPLKRRAARRALEVIAYWMPVWVPLVVLAQFGARGLKPARLEERRLATHEQALEQRRQKLLERHAELEALHEAHGDPIYQERLRRAAREGR